MALLSIELHQHPPALQDQAQAYRSRSSGGVRFRFRASPHEWVGWFYRPPRRNQVVPVFWTHAGPSLALLIPIFMLSMIWAPSASHQGPQRGTQAKALAILYITMPRECAHTARPPPPRLNRPNRTSVAPPFSRTHSGRLGRLPPWPAARFSRCPSSPSGPRSVPNSRPRDRLHRRRRAPSFP